MSEVQLHKAKQSFPVLLTEAAKNHVLSYLAKQPGIKGIRFSVKKTGCSGLSYVIDYVSVANNTDKAMPLTEEYMIYVDIKSYPYLKGMEVDYVKQELNFQFVFKNPNQTGQCGCGESFTID